jgi:tellurite resistance protein TerC
VMFAWQGKQAATEYFTGYLIEKSLSVDNVFVWALILSYFAVPRQFQFRVLFWGIFGALVMRFLFILTGVALLERFDWMLFVFGGFLIATAARLLRHKDEEIHPEQNPVLRLVRRVIPSTSYYDGQKLFTRVNGKLLATPLFAVLVVIESSDVVFAVDSIPAILAISREPFIVFSANAFAILGLRALYFLLADLRERFIYLQQGLAVILAFVGTKMVLAEWYHIPTFISLGVVAVVLTLAMVVSWLVQKPAEESVSP